MEQSNNGSSRLRGRRPAGWLLAVALCLALVRQIEAQPQPEDPFEGLSAEDAERSVRWLEQAAAAEVEARWADALALYDQAHEILPLEEYRFRSAICLEQLGRQSEALAIYEELSGSERDAVAESARQRVLAVEAYVASLPATLRVVPSEPEASVGVAGHEASSRTPEGVVFDLPAGEYVVRVELEGFVSDEREVTLAAGETRDLHVALEPDSALGLEQPLERDWTAPVVLGSLALASAGAGAVLAVLAQDRAEGERAYDRRALGNDREGAESLGDDAERLNLAGRVTFAVGGALAIAAVVVLLLDSGEAPGEDPVAAGSPFGLTAGGFTVAF